MKDMKFILTLVLIYILVVLGTWELRGPQHKKAVVVSICHAQADGSLPDPKCTPGALNHTVTQRTIYKTICIIGWTEKVRPSTSYTAPLKLLSMRAYGYTDSPTNYEFDHLIPLTLGGDPRSIKNLWPERESGAHGSFSKDGWERKLHNQVCDGKMKLDNARRIMAKGSWINGQ